MRFAATECASGRASVGRTRLFGGAIELAAQVFVRQGGRLATCFASGSRAFSFRPARESISGIPNE
jgi:hypothetical protein